MNHRTLAATAAALTTIGLLAACSSSDGGGSAASGDAPAGLADGSKLVNCIDPEYAPLEYYENGSDGEIVGFDADAARAIADEWGVDIQFEVTAFDGLMPALQSGRCDILLSGLYMSEERLQVADASPIMNAGPAIIASPEIAATLESVEDLCGLRVVAQAASANAAAIKQASEDCTADGADAIEVQEYPKVSETVLAVLNGKADALIETNVGAAYMVSQNKGELELAAGEIFPPDTTFGVFTKKGSELSQPVADALKSLYDAGTLAELAEKYELEPTIVDVY
ncbi:transporter substrate-binding domain-containing protein [Agromyces sp. NPDC058104]|uniref:transporter substrate-binding domain-containing protein n=1 Tax=Agromyces sp. NPDC058104 TaxID=3346342 RepID=UPI0036DD5E38